MSHIKLILASVFALALVACSNPTLPDPDPADTTYPGDADSSASTAGAGGDPYGSGEFMDDPSAGELGMVIYFEFDSSEVRAADQELVSRHAMQLGNNTRLRVRLEGHADERGSREYNIGLGERRAQAVRQMLMIQGVSAEQIATVSFGEERPVAFGSSDEEYAQNRRVEFKYTN